MTEEEIELCWKLIEQRASFVYHGPWPAPTPDATTAMCKVMLEDRRRMKEESGVLKSAVVGLQDQMDAIRAWRVGMMEDRRQAREEIISLKNAVARLREEIDELGEWRKTLDKGS